MSVGVVCVCVTPEALFEAAVAEAGSAIRVVTAIAAQVANKLRMIILQFLCASITDNARNRARLPAKPDKTPLPTRSKNNGYREPLRPNLLRAVLLITEAVRFGAKSVVPESRSKLRRSWNEVRPAIRGEVGRMWT